jgi:hypothetical protein
MCRSFAVAAFAWAGCILGSAHAQPRPPGVPGPVPVALGTRNVDVTWGTTPRRPDPLANGLASRSTAPVVGGAGGAAAPDPHASIDIQGLKGTLNKDDVHQAMDARQPDFDHCVAQARRNVQWLSGSLKFAFKVDGQGRVAELKPVQVTIGHRELERCLTQVVAQTQFPKPAGRATAEFSWGMSLEPVSGQTFNTLRASAVSSLVRKHKRELLHECEVPRRARFRITAYVSTAGNLMSLGGSASPAAADARFDCILDQVSKWHLAKQKRLGKLSFELR